MFTTNNNNDAGSVTDLAEKVFGKKLSLTYQSPINTCPVCGTPTSGVLCTPCATR
jgi:hypothetical protein